MYNVIWVWLLALSAVPAGFTCFVGGVRGWVLFTVGYNSIWIHSLSTVTPAFFLSRFILPGSSLFTGITSQANSMRPFSFSPQALLSGSQCCKFIMVSYGKWDKDSHLTLLFTWCLILEKPLSHLGLLFFSSIKYKDLWVWSQISAIQICS